ncbi:N-acetyl-gamma-glutamyl-phosphate reductase [Cecembia lonarensis]|uniref:N-acetyl-gamma-glutamyl-phosphate reductase n=1 Tax=Cecembia lonarensis (strain CCUG 58316 / KCTC 22772 / LW9) TaxID=1225176 RepID=K1L1L5_CECL9|nr:N-acetyl-gamma-glutamyl-phosphate reductase [Cecembia lonarensis]EKB48656.1 N-acetyl-gamma-glutamyl-phosphate reductase [Cecembia lonarensis LW9]
MQNHKKFNIAIVGASGFTGSELARLLSLHPAVKINHITSESHEGKKFSDLHPQFLGILDQTLESSKVIKNSDLDIIFLALPHGISMDFVKTLSEQKARIIDLSGDFRLESPEVYEAWYQKQHIFPEGFKNAVYGLPELHAEKIKKSRLIANPGCYPTASILSLAPLTALDMIETDSVVIDAKSGLTGAGVKASPTTHFSNVNENFKAYGIGTHRHTVEIEEQLGLLSNKPTLVQFTPHLLPVDRGILATAYAKPKGEMDQNKLEKIYEDFYADKPFVRIRKTAPGIKDVRGSHYCDIFPFWDERTNRIISISAIDNLLKGAASQAVHNMNLMLGLEEQTGLEQIPLRP